MTAQKPRSDAVLKTLPEARQAEIIEYLREHSLVETKSWLADAGVKTSVSALSEFFSWYQLQRQLERNNSTAETLVADLARKRPDLTPDQLFAAGQAFFSALAIEQRDALTWKRAQDAATRREALALEGRRIAVLERKAAQADEASKTLDSDLPPADKMARMRAIFGLS